MTFDWRTPLVRLLDVVRPRGRPLNPTPSRRDFVRAATRPPLFHVGCLNAQEQLERHRERARTRGRVSFDWTAATHDEFARSVAREVASTIHDALEPTPPTVEQRLDGLELEIERLRVQLQRVGESHANSLEGVT